MGQVKCLSLSLGNRPEHNLVLAQAHFIKTVEDVYEAMVGVVPGAKFGLAFCEASGPRLIRSTGTEPKLEAEAVRIAKLVGAGHLLVVVMADMYPINVLPRLKMVPEVVNVYVATANPVTVIVAEAAGGRGVLGVIDGQSPAGIEGKAEVTERHKFLRQIGYKQ